MALDSIAQREEALKASDMCASVSGSIKVVTIVLSTASSTPVVVVAGGLMAAATFPVRRHPRLM